MEHAVGVVGLAHPYGHAADGKEAAEEALDGSQVRCIADAVLCLPGAGGRRPRAPAGRVGERAGRC